MDIPLGLEGRPVAKEAQTSAAMGLGMFDTYPKWYRTPTPSRGEHPVVLVVL